MNNRLFRMGAHRFARLLARSIPALLAGTMALLGCSSIGEPSEAKATGPVTAPASEPASSGAQSDDWKQIASILGKPGVFKDEVYTVTFPRNDLTVRIEGMDIPTAAGIASTFHFYQCSCGKTVVVGEFVGPDYEANDVAYALQKQNILVSSIAPVLLYEKPRLLSVRFQAEGKAQPLAVSIKSALDWTGKNRMAPESPEKIFP